MKCGANWRVSGFHACGRPPRISLFSLFIAGLLASSPAFAGAAGRSQPKVTFNQQIAPIIFENCSTCHRPGESGPFSLLSYDDVKRHAAQIADVTKRRFMPPWLPEPGYGSFLEERRLTDEQIALIREWVDQGSPLGSTKHAPEPPAFSSEWQLGPPDMILKVAKPYQLAADGPEVFWNFIIPVPITSTKWVRAIEVRPGNPKVFHHANVIIDRSGAARRHEKTPGSGFEGMDLAVEESTFDPDGHFLSWKPGSAPIAAPEGMAWKANPGMDLVLNVHLRPTGKVETVIPEIGIYFTNQPQTKFPMLIQLEHDSSLNIKPGDKDFLDTDDFKVPIDLNVLAVYPHAHYLCKLMEGYATLPDGTKKWLIRIPDWDFNWQGVFRYKKPIFLPKGTVVSMRYHYDNSTDNVRNPSSPPILVRTGIRSKDEMGHLWLQVLPVKPGDQRAILQEAFTTQRLAKYPDDFGANFNMGDISLSKGNIDDAIRYFALAWRAEPDSVVAANDLGVALFTAQRVPDAELQFKKVLEMDPRYTDARYNLASAEAENGEWEAAAAHFRQVTEERPDNDKARKHLGEVLDLWGDDLVKAGRYDQAQLRYRQALAYRPDDAELHTSLGMTFLQLGRTADALEQFEAAVKIDPTFQPAQQGLARIRGR
jgi:tetratricopeptide (TPR) repeat protein/mono/diheme cytochrome c family protein